MVRSPGSRRGGAVAISTLFRTNAHPEQLAQPFEIKMPAPVSFPSVRPPKRQAPRVAGGPAHPRAFGGRPVFIKPHLLACLALVSCTSIAEPELTDQSYGRVRIGEPLARVEQALGATAVPVAGQADPSCRYVSFAAYPEVRFMVESGVVTRAELRSASNSALGVKIGDSMVAARAKLPEAVVRPHKYDPAGHYLILKSPDGSAAVVMEASGGKITEIRGGREPSVEYVEGCL